MAKTVQYKGYTVLTGVNWIYDQGSLTVTMYPSWNYPQKWVYKLYKKIWLNQCPVCGNIGVLLAWGAKGKNTTIEGEIYCTACGGRFDGVQGYRKLKGSKQHLTSASSSSKSNISGTLSALNAKQKKALSEVQAEYEESRLPKRDMTIKIPLLPGIMDGYCHKLTRPLVSRDLIVYVESVEITQTEITMKVNDKLEPPGEEYKPPSEKTSSSTIDTSKPYETPKATGANPYQTAALQIRSRFGTPRMGNPPSNAGTISGRGYPASVCVKIPWAQYNFTWVNYCPACGRSGTLCSTIQPGGQPGGMRCCESKGGCTADYCAVSGLSLECSDGNPNAARCNPGCGHRLTAAGSTAAGGVPVAGSNIEKKIMAVGNSLRMSTPTLTVQNIFNYLKKGGRGGFSYAYYYDWPGGDLRVLNTAALAKRWNLRSGNCVWFAWCFWVMCRGAGVAVEIWHSVPHGSLLGHLWNRYNGKVYDCTLYRNHYLDRRIK